LRRVVLLLLVAAGSTVQAQYVRDIVPKCRFARLDDSRVWSPDCRAYFEHEHFSRMTLSWERFPNGPQGAPFIPVVFTTPPSADEHWFTRERGVEYVAHDPTTKIREDIIARCPSCSLMKVSGTKWLDSERMVLIATVANVRGEVYQLQYSVVAKSGKMISAPRSSTYPK
jgi:hypothetical protein